MKIDEIEIEGVKLSNDSFYDDAISYLNDKFKNYDPDFIKEWLLKRGTMVTPLTSDGIASEIVLYKESDIKDKSLIFAIDECLEALALHFNIPNQRYHER